MKKYYDIWKTNLDNYQALLGTSENRSTQHDNENFYYLGTIMAESPQRAIDLFYQNYESNQVVLNKKCGIEMPDNPVIAWAKLLRNYYPLCPINKALSISKELFKKENEGLITITIDKNKIMSEEDEKSWFTDDYIISEEFGCKDSIFPLFKLTLNEPWIPFPCMFGEDVAQDNFEGTISDLSYKILEFVPEDNKKEVLSLIDKIVFEAENREFTNIRTL